MRCLFSFFLVLGVHLAIAQVQDEDGVLFRSVCGEIERQDRYWQAREKLPAFTVRVDSVKQEEWMEFADGTGKRIKGGKTEDKELYKVAHAFALPIFPLRDTLCVVDTLGIFKVQDTMVNGHYFYVHRCSTNTCAKRHDNTGSVYVDSYRTLGNVLNRYIYLSFTGSEDLFYCRFETLGSKVEFRESELRRRSVQFEKQPHLE